MSDFEYELQIAHTNRSLADKLETVFWRRQPATVF